MDRSGGFGSPPIAPQSLLAAIVDSSFDGILSKTLDGTITSWNAAAQRIFGYTAEEAVGQPILMLVPPERLDEEAWILARLRSGERVENFHTVRLHRSGRRIDVAVTSSPVRDASGTIVGASKIVRDVSQERAAAVALAESEGRLSAIVDSAIDGIITVDGDSRILVFNEAAARMLGCPRSDALGSDLARFLPERYRERHPHWMQAFGAAGVPLGRPMGRPGQITACRADGIEFPAEASISCVEVDGHELLTVILRDLSELRQAQSDRRALESQLREAQKMEAVGTLAGGIAHDFNNVLGAIVGNVALAKEDLPPDHPARTSIEQIEVAAQRARGVVRQILAFSRRQPEVLVVQSMGALVDEAVSLLRSTLPTIVRLDTCLAAEDLHVRVDANQMHQVLLNLCTNAWQALRGSTGRITVGVEAVQLEAAQALRIGDIGPGRYVRLWVADNGCGMDEATRARIFEPFFTSKPRGEGTGLGLAVVYGIVHAYEGAIDVESSLGAGTVFSVFLPRAEPAPVSADAAPAGAAPPARTGCVAYVDDDDVMRLMVERLLSRRGYQVRCFAEPLLLLEHLGASPGGVDLVVSDYNMPGMSGLDLARALAAAAIDVPVIVSSGYVSDELRASAGELGVRALLEKEDTLERLVPLVDSVLAQPRRPAAPARQGATLLSPHPPPRPTALHPASFDQSALAAAIIDLDGTMVDTVGDFEQALARTLADLGLPPVDRAFIARTVGRGSMHLLAQTLAHAGGAPTLLAQAWTHYRRHYADVNGAHAEVYPGVREGLAAMRGRGWKLACVTNKPRAFALALLESKGLLPLFEHVFGGDSFERHKPDPLPLLKTCEALGTRPACTLMVGDSRNDCEAARAAGCPVVLVSYGYNHGEPVADARPDRVIDRLDALA